ncbi:MAG: hypothetical protein DCF31_15115 [Alphaproteobacteria bacterium]|nr:MAG: hypothetical protein DCF31_15115 [Alphaproteobacteria bacterium]
MTALLERLRAGLKLPAGPSHARVLQAVPLGPGTRLLVVEFAGRQVLVGQGRGGLVALAQGEAA